jgi:hypothetical protein
MGEDNLNRDIEKVTILSADMEKIPTSNKIEPKPVESVGEAVAVGFVGTGFGGALVIIGILLSCTGIGIILGIPLILAGIIILIMAPIETIKDSAKVIRKKK